MTDNEERRFPRGSVPEPVHRICRRLRDHGHGAWIVGGCVRDVLLGREAKDWDVATSARPEAVQKLFRRVIPTGMKHGTVTVIADGTPFEVTTLRAEGTYSDGRHPDEVSFVDDIAADLARRDFTVNAIAYDPLEDVLVDPHGGLPDLDRGVVRAVGDARARFNEDGLRVLRAARFVATLQFDLDPATAEAIPDALDTYKKVSHERVRDEWLKAMGAPQPSRAFEVMRQSGILGVTFPEMLEQVGCEQNRYHAFDVWGHTMATLDASSGAPIERLAALLHDVGKPRSRAWSDKTSDWTFYHHERIGADMADRFLADFRFSNEERDLVVHLVRHHLICYAPDWSDAAVRRFVRRVGPERIDSLLRLGRADLLGKGRPVDDDLRGLAELRARADTVLAEGNALSVRDLAVSGRDVMTVLAIPPGPIVGRVLERMLELVIDDPSLNTRERLLGLIEEIAREAGEAR